MRFVGSRAVRILIWLVLWLGLLAQASSADEAKLIEAAEILQDFTAEDSGSIPLELLQRAHGIAVIPSVFRGGFILGGRRGRGVLVVRSDNGEWSNPAFITLTGGSIGWQIGAESADIVLIFANDRSIANISSGKFTLGGDASAVAGPLGRHATMAVTFKAEIYGYIRSRGLYAGAAFQGVRLKLDARANDAFYTNPSVVPLGQQDADTPPSVRRFLLGLERAALTNPTVLPSPGDASDDEVQTFPLN